MEKIETFLSALTFGAAKKILEPSVLLKRYTVLWTQFPDLNLLFKKPKPILKRGSLTVIALKLKVKT